MPSQRKKTPMWNGHPLLDEKHAQDLELAAAVNEFHHGLPRDEAEKQALDGYRREHHARAAAHHLQGMKASNATGSHEDGAQHYALYRLHVKALGHEPHDAVPPEVKRYSEGEDAEGSYRFRGHGADQFLVQHIQGGAPAPKPAEPVKKHEDDFDASMEGAFRQRVGAYHQAAEGVFQKPKEFVAARDRLHALMGRYGIGKEDTQNIVSQYSGNPHLPAKLSVVQGGGQPSPDAKPTNLQVIKSEEPLDAAKRRLVEYLVSLA